MKWKETYLYALDQANLFVDSMHRTRFKELVDCYSSYPFFSKGLCKCMYMSAWDEEHFCVILQVLMNMSIGRDTNTSEMRTLGGIYAEERQDAEFYVYELSNAFLDSRPYTLDISGLPEDTKFIINQSLKAAAIIDELLS